MFYDVSIIIPVYNVSKYLSRCLNSVLFADDTIEVIVVNDGSTDNSLDIINSFQNQYPKLKVVSQINRGLSAARNAGMRIATGKYLWFVDGDDYISVEEFYPILAKIRSGIDRDVFVFGRKEDFLSWSICAPKQLQYVECLSGPDYFKNSMSNSTFRTNAWDKLFRREFLIQHNLHFVEGLLYEDMYFCLQVFSYAKSVMVLSCYPYNYVHYNTNSITKQLREKDLDVLKFIRLADNFLMSRNFSLSINSLAYNVLIFRWVSSCLLKKYVPLSFSNSIALKIFKIVLQNKSFIRAVSIVRKNGNDVQEKLSATLLCYYPYLYRILIFLYLKFVNLKRSAIF